MREVRKALALSLFIHRILHLPRDMRASVFHLPGGTKGGYIWAPRTYTCTPAQKAGSQWSLFRPATTLPQPGMRALSHTLTLSHTHTHTHTKQIFIPNLNQSLQLEPVITRCVYGCLRGLRTGLVAFGTAKP
jgi:hypothetical protein